MYPTGGINWVSWNLDEILINNYVYNISGSYTSNLYGSNIILLLFFSYKKKSLSKANIIKKIGSLLNKNNNR